MHPKTNNNSHGEVKKVRFAMQLDTRSWLSGHHGDPPRTTLNFPETKKNPLKLSFLIPDFPL